MKKLLQGLGVYIISLIIAGLTAYWAGMIFFSDIKYSSGGVLISRDLGYFIYGLLITYPFFIPLGLIALLKRHQLLWTIVALVPIAVFLIAFGLELIIYSLIATVIGGLLGFFLSRVFARKVNK